VYRRISSTYVEMLTMLDWIMGIVNATSRSWSQDPSRRRSRIRRRSDEYRP
jgi:hypothetical protein